MVQLEKDDKLSMTEHSLTDYTDVANSQLTAEQYHIGE